MGDLEKFSSGEESVFHMDVEQLRDMAAALRTGFLYSMNDDLSSLEKWQKSIAGLDRMLYGYCTPAERKALERSRVKSLPNESLVKKYQVQVNVQQIKDKLTLWEMVCRTIMINHGFAIKAKEGNRSFILPGG